MLKKYFVPVLILLVIGYWVNRLLFNEVRVSKLHYGVKANNLRQSLHIPIIDNYMEAENFRPIGTRWESEDDLPTDNSPLHVWKIITPLSDTAGLYEELDAFRKRFNDSLFYQFNIHCKIIGDSSATREGKLFLYERDSLLHINLNEYKIDSIAHSWGLNYLIRNR